MFTCENCDYTSNDDRDAMWHAADNNHTTNRVNAKEAK